MKVACDHADKCPHQFCMHKKPHEHMSTPDHIVGCKKGRCGWIGEFVQCTYQVEENKECQLTP